LRIDTGAVELIERKSNLVDDILPTYNKDRAVCDTVEMQKNSDELHRKTDVHSHPDDSAVSDA
jgi:hypothetical protein